MVVDDRVAKKITYRSYALHNFRNIPQMAGISESYKRNMEVVGQVLPFKVNNYVINELINWDNVPDDPIFRLTFPHHEMLRQDHFRLMHDALHSSKRKTELKQVANAIRLQLNPHSDGQMEHNIPEFRGEKLRGIQHKYRETVLFFPSQGQTCHAYCTFCFRWPQFVGMDEMKFAMKEGELLADYLREHTEVTDVLFTGGDPLIMKTEILAGYIDKLLEARLDHLQTIRIGTKALGYWPYRFTLDQDADQLMRLFSKVTSRGINLAIMAHFNHPVELSTPAVEAAVQRIRGTGAQIRTQSPVLKHINAEAITWAEMWRKQVNLNCIPYYMFIPRDTGAQHYFAVPLVEAWRIFQQAYQQVSGVCRTVRGPSMSTTPGKVQILGVSEVMDEMISRPVMILRFLQGRNPDWVARPFFAEYDEVATWLDELRPAFGQQRFFFEEELERRFRSSPGTSDMSGYE